MTVRPAVPADAPALARLLAELGHPEAADGLDGRLAALRADPRAEILVAVDDADAPVGVATLALVPVAHDPAPWCRVTALVVDADRRGRGVGAALLAAAEDVARRAGCSRIEATSAGHRDGAHRLYDAQGYGRTSLHFLKRLADT